MRKNMPYMVLDITKKPGDPDAVKTGDMLLAGMKGFARLYLTSPKICGYTYSCRRRQSR